MEGDVITLQDIFLFDYGMGVDEHGRFRATSRPPACGPSSPRSSPTWASASARRSSSPSGFARTGDRLGPMSDRVRPGDACSPRPRPGRRPASPAATGRRTAAATVPRRPRGRRHRPATSTRDLRLRPATQADVGRRRRHRQRRVERDARGRRSCPLATAGGKSGRGHRRATPRTAMDPVMADIRDGVTARRRGPARRTSRSRIVTFARPGPAQSGPHHRHRGGCSTRHRRARRPTARASLWDGHRAPPACSTPTPSPTLQPNVVVMTGSGDLASAATAGDADGRPAQRRARLVSPSSSTASASTPAGSRTSAVARARRPAPSRTRDADAARRARARPVGHTTIDQQYVLAYEPPTGDGPGAVADITLQVGDDVDGGDLRAGLGQTAKPGPTVVADARPGRGLLLQRPGRRSASVLVLFAGRARGLRPDHADPAGRQPPDQRPAALLRGLRRPRSSSTSTTTTAGSVRQDAPSSSGPSRSPSTSPSSQGFLAGPRRARAGQPARCGRLRRCSSTPPWSWSSASSAWSSPAASWSSALIAGLVAHRSRRPRSTSWPSAAARSSSPSCPTRSQLLVGHAAGRLLAHAGRRGRVPGGRGPDGPRAASGRHRVPSRAARSRRPSTASPERMDSPDFAWAVMAIRIQREVGGNLSELLMTVAETMIAARAPAPRRRRAHRGGQGISAIVLGFLPIGLGRRHVRHQPGVHRARCSARRSATSCWAAPVLLAGIGFLWMKKIIDIEI